MIGSVVGVRECETIVALLRVVLAGGRVNTGGWITCRSEESSACFRRLDFLVQKPRPQLRNAQGKCTSIMVVLPPVTLCRVLFWARFGEPTVSFLRLLASRDVS